MDKPLILVVLVVHRCQGLEQLDVGAAIASMGCVNQFLLVLSVHVPRFVVVDHIAAYNRVTQFPGRLIEAIANIL